MRQPVAPHQKRTVERVVLQREKKVSDRLHGMGGNLTQLPNSLNQVLERRNLPGVPKDNRKIGAYSGYGR